jgi:hypothetical protein
MGGAKQRTPALRVAGQFRQIALAQHNRPGGLQPRHQGGVGGGQIIRQRRVAAGGAQALGGKGVLDADWQAQQRLFARQPARALGQWQRVHRLRGGAGALDVQRHQRADARVVLGNARHMRLQQLAGRAIAQRQRAQRGGGAQHAASEQCAAMRARLRRTISQ